MNINVSGFNFIVKDPLAGIQTVITRQNIAESTGYGKEDQPFGAEKFDG